MRVTLRSGLLVLGILAAFIFFSPGGRSELKPGGWETTASIGAVGPWLEYARTPQHMSYRFNLLSWSALSGFLSGFCFWLRSRLPHVSLPDAKTVDQPAPAIETGSIDAS